MKKVLFIIALLLVALVSSGCYWKVVIDETEVGIVLPDGVTATDVVTAGRYTNMGWYASLVQVQTDALKLDWSDPSVATSDKQVVAFSVTFTYRRNPDPDSVLNVYRVYRTEVTDDGRLSEQVTSRMADAVKAVTPDFTLDEMLGVGGSDVGRTELREAIKTEGTPRLGEIGVILMDVAIVNIEPSEAYLKRLEEKADAQAQVEIATARTLELQEKLKQETAQTDIEVEIARRARLVAEEEAKVIETSDRMFELEKLEALAQIFGSQDKIFFVPQGTDLTMLFGQNGLVPIQ